MKTTIEGMKEKEPMHKTEDKITVAAIVKSMKEEFQQQQKKTIENMTIEFNRQKTEIDKEWENRMDKQKRSDNAWDKRIKEQHEMTMVTVKKVIEQFTEMMNKTPVNRSKRKIDNTTENEEEIMEDKGGQEEMNFEEERTKLRR